MSIVLDEYTWAQDAISKKELGKKPIETLSRVAKYYTYKGYNKNEVGRQLENFILQCDPETSILKWADKIDAIVKYNTKKELILIDYISITESELDVIISLKSKMEQRLAFVLLCLAKYNMIINPESDYWVNYKISDIMAMANINTSVKHQCELYYNLREQGLIKYSKKVDSLAVHILFTDDDSIEVLKISDFRNLGYQYLQYRGFPGIINCEVCGITMKTDPLKKGRKIKYCPECALKMKIKKTKENYFKHIS